MTDKDELAALKARVAELEAKVSPKESNFVPEPYQQYDPTAGMSMPRSALMEMVNAVPDHLVKEIALRDARAPTGRPGMIPSSQQVSDVRGNVPGGGTGWQAPTPLSPPPGVAQADRIVDEFDRRDRAELVQRLGKR